MIEQLLVRAARAEDVPAIIILIREFAEFEKLSAWCEVTETDLQTAIFGKKSFVQALVALDGNRYAGYALYFPVFKSFRGERSIFLEDLYVTPGLRGQGLGFVMLKEVARYAKKNGFARMDWQALKWNAAAIDFYKNLGAETDDENFDFRLRGASFDNLAA
ncbi:MAG: GNAT family N-acetyltransferase [Acidobacteriota bacterium]|nr:GNAT family N-acetyltransferase [Acidobacteriota bacterium]